MPVVTIIHTHLENKIKDFIEGNWTIGQTTDNSIGHLI
jgi:hypothetical protein